LGRINKFFHLSYREKLLFSEALLMHLWTGLLLKIVPFRKIPGFFSKRQFETQVQDKSVISGVGKKDQFRHNIPDPHPDVVCLVKEAVARAGRVSPWKNRCLVSSLAARCMLNRRNIPSALSLGMAKQQGGKTLAHAWIIAGNIEVVERNGQQTELYSF
jgi:hypothetical protein